MFSHLRVRQQGHVSVAYLDDTWLAADDCNGCVNNVVETLFLLDRLGFVVNLGKSVLIPTQEIVFQRFILNSNHMTITLTPYGAQKLNDACLQLLRPCTHALTEVAAVLPVSWGYIWASAF